MNTEKIDDQQIRRTLHELERIEQGKLQKIGDQVLPIFLPLLDGLRPHGLNVEGKTRKGVPDSLVGADPSTCRVAVEYTTQEARLDAKLIKDFVAVRRACPAARTVVLCTTRSVDGVDLSALVASARRENVALEIVDGNRLSTFLCLRQDLRLLHLGIPVEAHTGTSLIEAASLRLDIMVRGKLPAGTMETYVARPRADLALAERQRTEPIGTTLIVAAAGVGKSTWSIANAMRRGGSEPVFWLACTDLPWAEADPIGISVVQAAYGAPDASRMHELLHLARWECRTLCVFVDGIDEVRDYGQVERALRAFRSGVLGEVSHIVLLCRRAALPLFEASVGRLFPELFTGQSEMRIALEPFSTDEAATFLQKHGASSGEIRAVTKRLPPRYRGSPLFLLRCFKGIRQGTAASEGVENIVDVLAAEFVQDMAQRMAKDGRGPSKASIRAFLGRLAVQVLRETQNQLRALDVAAISGGEDQGENSLVERGVQCGLLLRTGDDGEIGFAHAVFLEHFAAEEIERAGPGAWDLNFPALSTPLGRRVAARLASSFKDPSSLVEAIFAHDEIAACEAAANSQAPLDPTVEREILGSLVKLLGSRFPSDRSQSLRMLGRIRTAQARAVAVDWWNKLSPREHNEWLQEAAELFLSHELISAAKVILYHPSLQHPRGLPWYEPSFVRRMPGLSPRFRDALIAAARAKIAIPNQPDSSASLMLLAVLRDDWLTDFLRKRMSNGLLDQEAHRALIFLNTESAIDLYAESVEMHLEALRSLGTRGSDEVEEQARAIWGALVPVMADMSMYPHERLIDLVEAALDSNRQDHVSFGFQLAGHVGHVRLVRGYTAAQARFPNSMMALTGRMLEGLLRGFPFQRAKELYEESDPNARRDIVHYLHNVPGRETEQFLIDRLAEPQHRFSAIQSLGLLRAVRAGPAIHALLADPVADVQDIAVTALGRLQHAPSIGDLVALLERLSNVREPGQSATTRESNLEYGLVQAIGRIGGAAAYSALARLFSKTQCKEHVLAALLHAPDPRARAMASDLVYENPNARGLLVHALLQHDYERNHRIGEPNRAWLDDERLLDLVISDANAVLEKNSRVSFVDSPIAAVACFTNGRARRFLEDIAARTPLPASVNPKDFEVDPTQVARRQLGKDHPVYARAQLEAELGDIQRRPWVAHFDLRRLHAWPFQMVREAVVARLRAGSPSQGMMLVLRSFALAEDRAFFELMERSEDIEVADIAHRALGDMARHDGGGVFVAGHPEEHG